MNKSDELVLVFTGTEVEIKYFRAELEASGIAAIVKDGFAQGLKAGFVSDTASAIDLFVLAADAGKAQEIINDLKNTE
ncbi:MAG TPA: hypothetical protein DER09_14455 [Prolixibacteraceae bacterium]|nr:hypothetical protein [Prolixibacteraceae bacterium]